MTRKQEKALSDLPWHGTYPRVKFLKDGMMFVEDYAEDDGIYTWLIDRGGRIVKEDFFPGHNPFNKYFN
jgi:hypothetical protein